ncbi:hypothetical protein BJ912DRAFT_1052196 [Pholiota molesta]|nr:hypothetical protein BJ912DRAFT_1052196 [Pholiota molesta]
MASNDLIDAQFDRAVEIVQSLPKTGPIQTDYEEKLTILFKQATAGNVKSPRPGIWDMLGRAKWDAWAKHKDLDPYEAKWLYVEALLKVLRKYSDKTVAMNLVEELESYGGDPSHIVMSRTLSKSPGSDASGSTLSEPVRPSIPPTSRQNLYPREETDSTSEDESADEAREMPSVNLGRRSVDTARTSLDNRPQSSLSSHQRYRTPLAGSLAMSPPPSQQRVPSQQPLPGFQTPSAFAESVPPSSNYPHNPTYTEFNEPSRSQMMSPPHLYPGHPSYGSQAQIDPSIIPFIVAFKNQPLRKSPWKRKSPPWAAGRGSPNGNAPPVWDINDLGMWSLVMNPLVRGFDSLREFSTFFARNENHSPSMIIIRRLCLDVSFLVCVIAIIGAIWRKSGVRRREVKAALIVLWRAIVGSKPQRVLRDQMV